MKKIGLALGGGGARGAAHIGVLIELEQLGIRPDLIVGTSIGGMLGALYAAGLTTDELTLFFTKLNLSQLYTLPGSSAALTGTVKIEKLLENTIGRPTFDQLKYPLAVVTCDLVSRKVVVLDEGDVITAVLSTIAIPLLFPPVEKNGMALVDGGLMNNTPFDIALARGAAHTIAVDLTRSAPYGTPVDNTPPPGGVLERALSLTQRQKTWQVLTAVLDIITTQTMPARLTIGQPDVFLRPDLGTIGIFDFHRWQEGIEAGRTAAQNAAAALKKMAAAPER